MKKTSRSLVGSPSPALVFTCRSFSGVLSKYLRKALVPIGLVSLGLALSGCAAFRSGELPRQEITPLYAIDSPEFRQTAGSLLGPDFVPGNSITTLVNAGEIFPAMLSAIRSAKRSINFETYEFSDGELGREFTEALVERAQAAVKVNAIFDAQGTQRMGADNLVKMRKAGIQLAKYHSIFWFDPRRYDNRTHRKLLIIDGQIAFIGGVGIADKWALPENLPHPWRDNHFRVSGPVVAQLQAVFMSNWLKCRGNLLHGEDYFPVLVPTGPYAAQALRSTVGNENLDLMYLLTIASAKKSLLIENAYFLPDTLTRKELIDAAKRGVKIEIIMPGKFTNRKIVQAASKPHWAELIKAGIKIHEYQLSMLHVKLLIVDDLFVSIGSGNFDKRSIQLNDEANLNVLDSHFAAELTRQFEIDKEQSREIPLDETGGFHPIEQAARLATPEL